MQSSATLSSVTNTDDPFSCLEANIPLSLRYLVLLATVVAVQGEVPVLAHSGRTDSRGGHWDRKRGTYHFHNGGASTSRPITYMLFRPSRQNSSTRRRPENRQVTNWRIWSPTTRILDLDPDLECQFVEGNHGLFFEPASYYVVCTLGKHTVAALPAFRRIYEHFLGVCDKQPNVNYYLRGMSRRKEPWIIAEFSNGRFKIRYREVTPREVDASAMLFDDLPLRRWEDPSGRFSTEARLLGYFDHTAVLKKAAGGDVTVDLSSLSDGDRRYVRETIADFRQRPMTTTP